MAARLWSFSCSASGVAGGCPPVGGSSTCRSCTLCRVLGSPCMGPPDLCPWATGGADAQPCNPCTSPRSRTCTTALCRRPSPTCWPQACRSHAAVVGGDVCRFWLGKVVVHKELLSHTVPVCFPPLLVGGHLGASQVGEGALALGQHAIPLFCSQLAAIHGGGRSRLGRLLALQGRCVEGITPLVRHPQHGRVVHEAVCRVVGPKRLQGLGHPSPCLVANTSFHHRLRVTEETPATTTRVPDRFANLLLGKDARYPARKPGTWFAHGHTRPPQRGWTFYP